MNNNELWQAVLADIELQITPANFITWFRNTSISSQKEGDVVVINRGHHMIDTTLFVNKAITITGVAPDDPDTIAETVIDANGYPNWQGIL